MIFSVLALGNTSLASRKKIIELIRQQPNLIPVLLDFTFDPNCKVKVLASIILDDLLQGNPVLLDKYIGDFVAKLPLAEDESVKRLTSKMAVLLFEKRKELFDEALVEQLWNQSLVWLTSNTKVATEANAMHLVMVLYKRYPEQARLIAELIEVNFAKKTPAYQSKARKLLKVINKE
ncbi:hypothetical protein [Myroides indicus]|uniref:HEAT repeat protein n=1 Tax=Myroides indicus TaxID=1323422 RepID=A0A4R7F228_9FLAO|nr:hypothetical protein [Myroides indicus]TDS62064.1 hypothetical protein C8P70_10730 [Myroides indicus]